MQSTQEDIDHSIEEEGLVSAPIGTVGTNPSSGSEMKPPLRFGYMFPDLERFRPSDESLVELGHAMLDGSDLGEHPTLPAGYTYLGQFIAHDMTYDPNLDVPDDLIDASKVENGRTPFLDLDSLYGAGSPQDNKQLYSDSLLYLKVGSTSKIVEGVATRSYLNDLPRDAEDPKNPCKAIIADPRNDENLALAQFHVAFLKFHNSVVEQIKQDDFYDSISALFEQSRKKVIQHYHWIILKDFLPRIIDESVLNDEVKKRIKLADAKPKKALWKKALCMPVEFSAAAYRLGHSMLRDTYEWNRFKQSPMRSENLRIARLSDLMRFTGRNGNMGGGGDVLPSDWIIDWTRFFDFTGFNGIVNNPKSNHARKIDTTLTPVLKDFETFLKRISKPEFRSLPVIDLIRGSRLGLPSGQAVAKKLGLTPLSPSEVRQEPHREVLKDHGFDKKTPLWYYILKEAQLYHGGKRLGPVGSRIVARTFAHLIWTSPNSILKERGWKPDLGQKERGEFGMADLLVFANVVNPLGS